MSYFKRIALLKSHQKLEPPEHTYASDLTEICYLGAAIENDVEYVSIPVSPYTRNPFKTFEKRLKRERFDFVGISSMTAGYISARKFASLARKAGAYVVMGGYHATALTDDVLADPNVDAVVRGEGDLTFKDLILHGPSQSVLGLSYEQNGEPIHNPDRPLIADLDTLPQPLRKIRPPRFGQKGDQYTIDSLYSSRGCIAKCTFCANDTVNKAFRARSPEHFVEELEQVHDKNIRKIVKFWDSIFLFDPKRVEAIIQLMFKRNLTNFRIITESRSDDVIRCAHLMKDLRRIGFEKIQIGIESPDPETFKRLKKGGSVTKHEKAVRLVQDAGMHVEGFFIIGHPHETEADIKKYPEFALRMGINQRAFYFVMTPYPGTQIYREYYGKKLIESFDWDCYCNFGTVVHLEKLKRSELRNLMSYCYGVTWGFPYIFERQRNIPFFIFQLGYTTLMMLYFLDVQTERGLGTRNEFIRTFFEATFGRFCKRQQAGLLGRVYQFFFPTFKLRYRVSEDSSFVMSFHLKKDEVRLKVCPYEKKDGRLLTVTLDDFDYLHRAINVTDANALMFLFQKKGKLSHYWHQLHHYFPTLFRAAAGVIRVILKVGWRFVFPGKGRESPQPVKDLASGARDHMPVG
ncbi:MAG: B12-binding domain-containing radical SAM protein [Nitrospinaceae bacterium]